MVTSNNIPDKKVFKMSADQSNAVVPQRTLLGEVNAHLTCYLCRGYYIDATTIVECLHSFCRSCIIKHLQAKSYCPVCEMMINSAKPNIKPDKALQDIVYKLVPGLFQREMERRRLFYSSRPGPAATATPEQRGEDTERIIFSPEDVISFSLEYADATDTDSISSKSSDSNEQQPPTTAARRFLQCPAVVNISHLKKFLSMKFDIDSTQFSVDILYKRVPLPDYYTLMDIAYIYNWKRNKPMRFFYQIIDYIAIRSRYGLFDINRKGSHFHEKKNTHSHSDEVNFGSSALQKQEHGSEASSGTDSPMPEDSNLKNNDKHVGNMLNVCGNRDKSEYMPPKNNDEDVEKSQFLNSFELTAKNNSSPGKSPTKSKNIIESTSPKSSDHNSKLNTKQSPNKSHSNIMPKLEDNSMKRKHTPPNSPEMKKIKIDLEKVMPHSTVNKPIIPISKTTEIVNKPKESSLANMQISKSETTSQNQNQVPNNSKDNKQVLSSTKLQNSEKTMTSLKRPVPGAQSLTSPKRKAQESTVSVPLQSTDQKLVSPLKIQLPKLDVHSTVSKSSELPKPVVKKMPELKLGITTSSFNQQKGPINKVRMDLLANNCDPTMDRSKILSHVKTTMSTQGPSQSSGDPLKSLFDSCKINIPSSLSITLSDQKLDSRSPETVPLDPKNSILNKNTAVSGMNNMHKVPSPPVHNYIEILKLPDVDPKKCQTKAESVTQYNKPNPIKKPDFPTQSKPSVSTKQPETPSAKGPIPSLKPIGETKLVKQSGSFPVTSPFQQKYIQSLEQAEKSKVPRIKLQVPKLMPATPKILNAAANKEGINKTPIPTVSTPDNKGPARSDNVLDLSTSHNLSQLGPQQTKTLETMQNIANLAKKHTLSNKGTPISMQQNNIYSGIPNRVLTPDGSQLRFPNSSQLKSDKIKILNSVPIVLPRQEMPKPPQMRPLGTPNSTASSSVYQTQTQSAYPPPRQTRSPSSSPKLVIAEEKQSPNVSEAIVNQSNQISSTQLCNLPKTDPSKVSPGPSKIGLKSMKPLTSGIRQTLPSTMSPGPIHNTTNDIILQPQMLPQVMLRHMEWLKTQQVRQYENLFKNMSNMQQNQKDFNKDPKP